MPSRTEGGYSYLPSGSQMAMMAVSAMSGEVLAASSRSVVNVAMPHRRGRALPIKAILSGRARKLSQCFPFCFFITSLTGKVDVRVAVGFDFAAFGLRISRLLFFCDFAILDCSTFVFSNAQFRYQICRAWSDSVLERLQRIMRMMRIRMCVQDRPE